jgi:predicted nucleotidyltransferase
MTRLEALLRRTADRRRGYAVAAARRATERLRALGVEVRVIGSLAAGGFKPHSDVDLLVVRCPPGLRYAIEGVVEDEMGGLPFDVVYLDEVPPADRTALLEGARHAAVLP